MATDHTDGEPPSRGNTIFANIGCRLKRSSAEANSVAENNVSVNRCTDRGIAGTIAIGLDTRSNADIVLSQIALLLRRFRGLTLFKCACAFLHCRVRLPVGIGAW